VENRRWKPRIYLQLDVSLEIPFSSEPVSANLHDISLTGAFIETLALLSTSTPLIVALKLPGAQLQKSFRLCARVVRRTQTGVGVAFLPMPADMVNALGEALSRHEQQSNARPDTLCG
jgi:hypothetical protein